MTLRAKFIASDFFDENPCWFEATDGFCAVTFWDHNENSIEIECATHEDIEAVKTYLTQHFCSYGFQGRAEINGVKLTNEDDEDGAAFGVTKGDLFIRVRTQDAENSMDILRACENWRAWIEENARVGGASC